MKILGNLVFTSIFLFSLGALCQDQSGNDGSDELSDDQVILKKFTKTITKLALYNAQLADPESVVDVADTYGGIPLQAGILAIRNPSFKNIKDGIVSGLLPDYSKQGTYLETIYDKELMRDIDQYIKYVQTFMDYGLIMSSKVGIDGQVRNHLSPENTIEDYFEEVDGVVSEEETFGGLTTSEYQSQVTAAYQAVGEYEPTGIAEEDDAAIQAIIAEYFSNEQDQENVLILMGELSSAEYVEDDEDANSAIVTEIFDAYFERLEIQKQEAEAAEEEAEEDIFVQPGNEGWENGLNALMADMGEGNRSVSARYGDAAEPYYSNYKSHTRQAQENTQIELTNIVKIWESLQAVKYIEMGIEMEQIGRELLENGVNFDTSEIKDFFGEMKRLWDAIKNTKDNG